MTFYTLNPDNDKAQVSGGAITASSTIIDGGSSIALGTAVPSDSVLTDQLQLGDRREVFSTQIIQSKDVFGALQSSPVTITSVADNGSGKARYTLAAHGLSVGTVVNITGSTNGVLDGPQTITADGGGTFDTDRDYVAAATAGDYTLVAGNFATMTAEAYIMLAYSSNVAGVVGLDRKGFGSDYGIRRSIHKLEHLYSRLVATAIRAGNWNIYTGKWSTDPTVQDDAPTWGTDDAANPTRAIPGELTYRVSGQPDATNGITQDDYEAKTS